MGSRPKSFPKKSKEEKQGRKEKKKRRRVTAVVCYLPPESAVKIASNAQGWLIAQMKAYTIPKKKRT